MLFPGTLRNTKLNTKSYNALVLLSVGNKDDDADRKVVLTSDAQRFAEQMGIELYETSAKDNKNVEEVSI